MPARTVSDARIQATHEAAMAIIAAERKRRDEKTAKLRAAREAAEQTKDRGGKASVGAKNKPSG
jgi:hypothetical protein